MNDTKRYLQDVRDGVRFGSGFYLGSLGENSERFMASLGCLHTIEIPTDQAEREQFVDRRRRWSLEPSFKADLHFRLGATFSRLGFDDHRWYSDADLAMMIEKGNELCEIAKDKDEARSLLEPFLVERKRRDNI